MEKLLAGGLLNFSGQLLVFYSPYNICTMRRLLLLLSCLFGIVFGVPIDVGVVHICWFAAEAVLPPFYWTSSDRCVFYLYD